jgi:endonuclease/exonuclease/phosphatase family metal-dependent hydrolase
MSEEPMIGPVSPPDLHVMTFNVRRRLERRVWRTADKWTWRRPALEALLRSERPTLLGVQEARPDQTEVIADLGYRFAGTPEAAQGRGEGCPLFYDAERLELLEWTQEALSDRPDVAGSRSWGNLLPRILVSARLRDRATHAELRVINTHFDHLSPRSRIRSAEMIRARVAGQELPAIVMGDLNASEHSRPVLALLHRGVLTDAWAAAYERLTPEWGTFADYRHPRVGGARIDWIAVTPTIEVRRIAINPRRFERRWPSDHLPVQAVVRLPATEAGAP